MNKLVSKSPILRFKLGEKIMLYRRGNLFIYSNGNEYWRGGSDWYYRPIGGTGMTKVDYSNKRFYSSTPKGTIANDFDTAKNYRLKNGYIPIGGVQAMRLKYLGKSNMDVAKEETHNYLEGLRNKYSRPFLKNNSSVKTITPVDNYYLKGFENRKDEIAKLGGVRAVLKMLGFTAGNGLDGKWGQNTEDAYLKYLIANAAKTPSLEDTISVAQNLPILSTPTINPSEYTFTESQLSGLGENPYYELHPELRFNNFDRTQTRQWLRDNGFNPYSLTGALRKALRMILNGLGTDEDKNLIGLTNGLSEILTNYKYLKQGGIMNILPSRNIVERFKNGGVLKFLKAGNLPTAPKAKDRYKDSKRYDLWIGPEGMYNEKSVRTNDLTPGWITQTIRYTPMHKSMDTTYTETPPSILPVNKQKRIAIRNGEWKGNSFVSNPKEYEILKRRFNIAWNLAK